MINKAASLPRTTFQMFKMISKNQTRYLYGKLEHFFANYEMSEFESPKIANNKFQYLIEDIFHSNSLQFNTSLASYLNVNDIEISQLIILLEKIYLNNLFLSRSNKQCLTQIVQNQLNSFNEDTISIINQACQLGFINEQLMETFINQFTNQESKQYNFTIQVQLLYIFGQALLKYNNLTKNEIFIRQWQELIKNAISNYKPDYKISGCMFSQISFLIKGLFYIKLEQEATYLGQIIELYKCYYKLLISNFAESLDFNNMSPKESTILLTALLKLKDQFLKQEISLITQSLLNRIQKTGVSAFSDLALQSFVFNLTQLGDYQQLMAEDILQLLQQRVQSQQFSPRIMIVILFEMHLKWSYTVSKEHLLKLISSLNIKEIPDFELGSYFQLLTLLPLDQIQHIISNIESEMIIREQFQKVNQQFIKNEPQSTDRMRRSLQKLINLLQNHGKNTESLERTLKKIF
ncbi:unnamed protein product [Paramecium primaurelia]|uniref:Uncharacterized protein n=1 Tax=Paramecium primaurelia TaxID=5886 RepID=A0A8S1QKT8_PARPR|nr:unnamed protein product [Paramecium primaurelia]